MLLSHYFSTQSSPWLRQFCCVVKSFHFPCWYQCLSSVISHRVTAVILRLKCDGTRAETRFRLSAKRTSPFKSAGASVHSTTGSRSVRISSSNDGYTMFRGSVKSNGYPLHSPVSPSLPLACVTVCHHVSTGLYQLANFSKSVAANILPRRWRHDCLSATNSPDTFTGSVSSVFTKSRAMWGHILTDPLTPIVLKLYISYIFRIVIISLVYQQNAHIQGVSNMTGTVYTCLHTNQSRLYLNHLVQ